MTCATDWLIWQLADSAFPGGGFAHSQGLESTWRLGEIAGESGLIEFIETTLRQSARGGLPFVLAAWDGADLSETDHRCDAFLSNEITNRASRATGRGYLAACRRSINLPAIDQLAEQVKADRLPGHWPVVFGAIARLLGLSRSAVARLFLFVGLRGVMSAAVRLGVVGPIRGQAIQFQMHALGESLATRAGEWGIDDAAEISPAVALFQGAHDRLYSKLFLS